MHKLHHYHIYDVINTSLPWAGRVWRGRVINTCPRSPSLCSAVPLFGRPFDLPDTNDLISTSPARAHLLLRNSFVLDDSSLRNSFVLDDSSLRNSFFVLETVYSPYLGQNTNILSSVIYDVIHDDFLGKVYRGDLPLTSYGF